MSPKRYILGVGTGRSGTRSLARLLDAQRSVCASHERVPYLPWGASDAQVRRALDWLEAGGECKGSLARPVFADVGCMWINALDAARERFGEALTVICIRRDKDQTVQSWMRHHSPLIQRAESKAERQFPAWDDVEPEAAWARWWDWYHDQIPAREQVSIQRLNSNSGQGRILSMAGIPKAERIYLDECHYNQR